MGNTTFYQLWNRLIGETYSDLPSAAAKQMIQDSWRDILNKREWSFLHAESVMVAPAVITGNITFTQYSEFAVPDATLKTILDSLSSPPALTRRSIRVPASTGTVSQSRLYDINAYDPAGAGTLTLSRIYQETGGLTAVQIYRRYYLPVYDYQNFETDDFRRFLGVLDLDNNQRLSTTADHNRLNLIDPRREATGTPLAIVPAIGATPSYGGVGFAPTDPLVPGTTLYELWPHYVGTVQKTYQVFYCRAGMDLTEDFGSVTSVLPPQLHDHFVIDGARARAYRWAETNKGRIPSLQKTNWIALMREAMAAYEDDYLEMRRIDDELMPEIIPLWMSQTPLMPGINYFQTHSYGEGMVFAGAGLY
jgi:hypothetical protein